MKTITETAEAMHGFLQRLAADGHQREHIRDALMGQLIGNRRAVLVIPGTILWHGMNGLDGVTDAHKKAAGELADMLREEAPRKAAAKKPAKRRAAK